MDAAVAVVAVSVLRGIAADGDLAEEAQGPRFVEASTALPVAQYEMAPQSVIAVAHGMKMAPQQVCALSASRRNG
jgi:hypothetical protein